MVQPGKTKRVVIVLSCVVVALLVLAVFLKVLSENRLSGGMARSPMGLSAMDSTTNAYRATSYNYQAGQMMPSSTDSVVMEKAALPGTVNVTAPSTAAPVVVEKKIIKNGSLVLQVSNIDQSLSQIEQITCDVGGDVFSSYFTQAVAGNKSGTVTVKVPVDKFQEAFDRLKGVATLVLSENTSGSDVTAQYIDLQARINNKKAAEATLQTLFDRAQKISDVIEVTSQLEAVRADIEALEGQMRYLNAQTDMASITISLTEDVKVVSDQGFRPLQTLKESLRTLVHMLGNIVLNLIRFVIVSLPVLLLYGGALWFLSWVGRKLIAKFLHQKNSVKRVIKK